MHRRFSPLAICLLALTCVTLPGATAQTVSILHNFGADGDAAEPDGVLIFDKAGNAYGVSYRGGTTLNGTVYELSPSGSSWNETILHSFNASAGDGQTPQGSLAMDSAGNLYGTTQYGGSRKIGIVYKLSPASGGTWTEKIIHTFIGGTDGRFPQAGLILDKKGNLYGTANQGGTGGTCGGLGCGVVFELSPKSGGAWTEKILHTFKGGTTDGANPIASLVMDSAGNLYGTDATGGAHSGGTAFKLTANASGGWTQTILHSFNASSSDGSNPYSNLVFDSAGNLYGTTGAGGTNQSGTVFKLTPGKSGSWTESVLHTFGGPGTDGQFPYNSGVIFDSLGNLYGTTGGGGSTGQGVVYKMSPASGGGWTEIVYVNFDGTNGIAPTYGLTLNSAGNIYGTALDGGTQLAGTAFEIVP